MLKRNSIAKGLYIYIYIPKSFDSMNSHELFCLILESIFFFSKQVEVFMQTVTVHLVLLSFTFENLYLCVLVKSSLFAVCHLAKEQYFGV